MTASLPAQLFGERPRSVFDGPAVGEIAGVFDADGDGDQDLLTRLSSTAYIYTNDGFGRFTLSGAVLGPVQAQSDLRPTFADLDGDGDTDFCAGTTAFENNGGTFTVMFQFPTSLSQNFSQLLDYDGDGDLDYLVYIFSLSANGIRLFENDGTGNFTDVTPTALAGLDPYASSFFVGDADGDGDPDVLLTGGPLAPLSLRMWINQNGVFTNVPLAGPPQASIGIASHVYFEDVDGDTHPDLTVASFYEPTWTALNDGAGNFTEAPTTGLPAPSLRPQRAFGDWDGDGSIDQVTRGGAYLQTQPLQFTFEPFEETEIAGEMWLADLDADQDLDLIGTGATIVLNTFDGGVLANRATPEPPFVYQLTSGPLDSRSFAGANPAVQILWRQSNAPTFFTDAVANGQDPDRRLREIALPTIEVHDGAIVHNALPQPSTAVVLSSDSGVEYFELGGSGFTSIAALPTLDANSSVAAAQLDDVPGEELVFGNPSHDGPRIFVRLPNGFTEFSPNVPPATPSTAPSFETIELADIDGDGDVDVVHEHRVLYNDGGCAWSLGPDFSQFAFGNTETVRAIDFDGDGDRDLLLSREGAAPVLLENTGAGFADVTATTMPPTLFHGAKNLTVGDVDRDGLDDFYLAGFSEISLLRNVGGSFVQEPSPADFGALIDINHDGRPDVFTGYEVQANLHTHLHAPHWATPGSTWRLDVETWRNGVTAHTAFVGIGTQELYSVHPAIGTLYLDSLLADVVSVPLTTGTGQRLFAIPSQPALLGTSFTAQAIVVDDEQLHLSNAVRDRIR